MRTTGRPAPDAHSPWDEIVPLLWMGGHYYRDPTGARTPAIVADEFDLLISLYTREGHGPCDTVRHHRIDVPDGPLTADQIEALCRAADLTTEALNDGRRVLVRCHSGYNRSGLVVAQTLINQGYSTDDAIFLIRYRRSKWALNNPLFIDYLTTGLDVARLLTDLNA